MNGRDGEVILEIREERVRSVARAVSDEEEVNKSVTCSCARRNGARP